MIFFKTLKNSSFDADEYPNGLSKIKSGVIMVIGSAIFGVFQALSPSFF